VTGVHITGLSCSQCSACADLCTVYFPAPAAEDAVAAGKPESLGAGSFCLHNPPSTRWFIITGLLEKNMRFFSTSKTVAGSRYPLVNNKRKGNYIVDRVPSVVRPGHLTGPDISERKISLNAALITRQTNRSAEETRMADTLRKLACGMLLLALVGTVSAGYGTAAKAGTGGPRAGSSHGDAGLLSITGEPGTGNVVTSGCHFPIYNLPAYYVCIMFCKIGGGGDSCAPLCEAILSVCD